MSKVSRICQGEKRIAEHLQKKHLIFYKMKNLNYPKDPRKLTVCQSTTYFIQIALTPKTTGLVWSFFTDSAIWAGSVILQVAPSGSKWLQIAPKCTICLYMSPNSSKWHQISMTRSKSSKSLQIAANSFKNSKFV